MLVLLLRGPHCARYTWFGHEGGLSWRKPKAEQIAEKQAAASDSETKDKNAEEAVNDKKKGVPVEGKADGQMEGQSPQSSVENPSVDLKTERA